MLCITNNVKDSNESYPSAITIHLADVINRRWMLIKEQKLPCSHVAQRSRIDVGCLHTFVCVKEDIHHSALGRVVWRSVLTHSALLLCFIFTKQQIRPNVMVKLSSLRWRSPSDFHLSPPFSSLSQSTFYVAWSPQFSLKMSNALHFLRYSFLPYIYQFFVRTYCTSPMVLSS